MQVFRARTSPEAIDLVSRLLEYTPSARISPLQACAHSFFDELREAGTKLPNGRDLPQLFNFTEQELKIQPSLNSQLLPPHLGGVEGGEGAAGGAAGGHQATSEPEKQVRLCTAWEGQSVIENVAGRGHVAASQSLIDQNTEMLL